MILMGLGYGPSLIVWSRFWDDQSVESDPSLSPIQKGVEVIGPP